MLRRLCPIVVASVMFAGAATVRGATYPPAAAPQAFVESPTNALVAWTGLTNAPLAGFYVYRRLGAITNLGYRPRGTNTVYFLRNAIGTNDAVNADALYLVQAAYWTGTAWRYTNTTWFALTPVEPSNPTNCMQRLHTEPLPNGKVRLWQAEWFPILEVEQP